MGRVTRAAGAWKNKLSFPERTREGFSGEGRFWAVSGDGGVLDEPLRRYLWCMTQTDSYRSRAAECLQQARRARAEEDKASFLEMADEWLSLAASGKSRPAPFAALIG